MRITIVGCSGSFPGPASPASCYLVEAEGIRMLLDLGNGALGALQRRIGLFDVDVICLSHLHADHCLDLCSYWVARRYAPDGPKPPIPVYGPAATADRMAGAYGLPTDPGMRDAFDFRTLLPGVHEIGPFRVRVDHVNHPVETFAFRVEHGGRALVYSGDTGESEALVRLAHGADLMLCEASFLDQANLPTDLHLTGRQAGEHAARAEVQHLVLTHLVPWNDPDLTLEEATRAYRGRVTAAVAETTYDLR